MLYQSRTDWGARYGTGAPVPHRPVPRVVVHHSASPDIPAGEAKATVAQHVQSIERHHVETNGWAAIGYNWMIDQDGRIWEGRGWGRAGAHAGNAHINQTSIGLCFLIDGEKRSPTDAAWDAARSLIREAVRLGELSQDYEVTGHRDHRDTSCPGSRVYPEIGRLRGLGKRSEEMLGRRVWSPMHGWIVVSQYSSDTDWRFVRAADLEQLPSTPAGTPLSQMPEHP